MTKRSAIRGFPCAPAAGLVALAAAAPLHAQWTVDPTTAYIDLWGQVYADHEADNPMFLRDPVPRLGPGQAGDCPPYFGPLVLPHPFCDAVEQRVQVVPFPGVFFDFGHGLDEQAEDVPLLGFLEAYADMAGYFVGDGLGARSLVVYWNTDTNNEAKGEDYFTRGCIRLQAGLRAEFQVPPSATRPVLLRYDLESEGDADATHECQQLPTPQACIDWFLPPSEDPERAEMQVVLDIDDAGPFTLFAELLDPLAGFPAASFPTTTYGAVTYPAGPRTITVDADVVAQVSTTLQYPEFSDVASANFDGILSLHMIYHHFDAGEDFDDYMRPIPAAGPGPRYAYRIGRSEVTNQQYADFLNAAELDGGASGAGSFMVFGADGDVSLPDGTPLFRPQGPLAPESHIVYAAGAPLGTRYTVAIAQKADPRSYGRHPVNYVSWYGALKFLNWLTLERGLDPRERCYREGPNAADWHPVTITTADWATRDLNPGERGRLTLKRGFRLPMDDLGALTGYVPDQARPYNEWYKAAAFDPLAPPTTRVGPGGESVPPYHWVYGVGRDGLGGIDANFLASGDAFDEDDAFVALYDGTTYNTPGSETVGSGLLFTTAPSTNPWGLYDMSGNVQEWSQDRTVGRRRALRSGSYLGPAAECAAARRSAAAADELRPEIGFRIGQSLAPRIRLDGPAQPF